tara:strand:- start:504 stop:701 length:198 start_codon:yes stop_codon:yes gene_type:complete
MIQMIATLVVMGAWNQMLAITIQIIISNTIAIRVMLLALVVSLVIFLLVKDVWTQMLAIFAMIVQ